MSFPAHPGCMGEDGWALAGLPPSSAKPTGLCQFRPEHWRDVEEVPVG